MLMTLDSNVEGGLKHGKEWGEESRLVINASFVLVYMTPFHI